MRIVQAMRCGLVVLVLGLVAAAPAPGALFSFDGKVFTVQDLKTAEQQTAYDLAAEQYAKLTALSQVAVLNYYFDAEATKTGKPRATLEAAELGVSEPTDKQVSEWFEANKSRIPPGYTLEKISGEIKGVLREQSTREKREALLAKLKSGKRFVLLLTEPEAPQVELHVQGFPVLGDAGAKVTVVEFADYQCPHCKAANPVLEALVKKHNGKIKLVFIDYPIKGEFSQLAAYGAYCAGQQGKYWEFHDLAYDKQSTLASKDAALTLAKELKLDDGKFSLCLSSDAAKKHVEQGKAEGDRVGLTGTPLIFINGKRIKSYDQEELERLVKPLL